MAQVGPKGWNAGVTDTRFADVAPQSYSKKDRTVDAVISMGSPVQRFYGTEVLRIDSKSVMLDRLPVPLLDSHSQASITNALGRVTEAWFNRGALMGKLKFNETAEGRKAEGMVARGEIAGISAGYRVEEWEITDSENNVIDPERMRWDDDGLTFTATRWELVEASLVACPADGSAGIRLLGSGSDRAVPEVDELARRATRITKQFGDASITYELPASIRSLGGGANTIADVRARVEARQAMYARHSEYLERQWSDDDDQLGGEHAEAWRYRMWRPLW